MKFLQTFAIATVVVLGSLGAVARPTQLTGAFALAGVAPKSEATMRVTPLSPLVARLEIALRRNGVPLRRFDAEMTQRMHLVAIDSSFTSFAHLHPEFDPTGTFTLTFRAPHPGTYDIYADSAPHGLPQQVFRFAVAIGGKARASDRRAISAALRQTVSAGGGYVVRIGSTVLPSGRESHLAVSISKDGRPASDLRPYLGGAAHAVFIDLASKDYLHVHPTDAMDSMGAMDAMPGMAPLAATAHVHAKMVLHVTPPHRGLYKLWLQFRATDGLHVAPFWIRATSPRASGLGVSRLGPATSARNTRGLN